MYNEEKMTEILEGYGIDEDKVTQIIDQLKEQISSKKSSEVIIDDFLEGQIEREKDPFKKSALIAKRISKSFE